MKTILPTLFLSLFLFAGFAQAVGAQTANQAKGAYDTNRDGILDENERTAAKQALTQKFDTNGDGQLSEQEKKHAKNQLRQTAITLFDTDGDGQLSEAEREQARQMIRSRMQQRGGSGTFVARYQVRPTNQGDCILTDSTHTSSQAPLPESLRDKELFHRQPSVALACTRYPSMVTMSLL